jgi:hypothetical protein
VRRTGKEEETKEFNPRKEESKTMKRRRVDVPPYCSIKLEGVDLFPCSASFIVSRYNFRILMR